MISATRIASAGALAPPAGPVSSTQKTLDEMAPSIPIGPVTTPGDGQAVVVINQPGRYHLTGDLLGEVGKDGISIETSQVWIDLNGFTLQGVPGSVMGINAGGSHHVVENGTVQGWGTHGVVLSSFTIADNPSLTNLPNRFSHLCRDLIVVNNGGVGIAVGSLSTVIDCDVR